jgi:hypothetical protein
MSKKTVKSLIAIFIVTLIVFNISNILMLSSSEMCASFIRIDTIRSNEVYIYQYKFRGQIKEGNVSKASFGNYSLDRLKEIECVKIEVSNIVPAVSRIISR